MGTKIKFGSKVTNKWASDDNPTKHGIFVRLVDRCNVEITDGKGEFWQTSFDAILPAHSGASTHGEVRGIQTVWGMVAFADAAAFNPSIPTPE